MLCVLLENGNGNGTVLLNGNGTVLLNGNGQQHEWVSTGTENRTVVSARERGTARRVHCRTLALGPHCS